MLAADVMSSEVTTVGPETDLEELVELLSLKRVSGAPVVDAQGVLVGVVSLSDVAQTMVHRAPRGHWCDFSRDLWPADLVYDLDPIDLRLRVADIMNETTFEVEASTPVSQVVDMLLNLRVHRVVVVDHQRRVVGVITTFDLVRLLPDLLGHPVKLG